LQKGVKITALAFLCWIYFSISWKKSGFEVAISSNFSSKIDCKSTHNIIL